MYSRKVTSGGKRFRDFVVASLFLFTSYEIRTSESRAVGCGGKPADVVFLLDASNSIWRPHFRRQLQFVKDMIDWFPVGRDAMRVALVTYADYPQIQFRLHDHLTKPRLHAAVDAVRQNGGLHTRTGRALAYARQNVLLGRSAGDEVRSNATRVVVVVTDGLSDNRLDTAVEARRTRDAGIHVFSVGVGKDVDLEELNAIASSPSKYYTFLVDGYEGLSNILELLAIKTCEVTDPTTSTTTTTTTTTTTMTTTVATSTTATTPTSPASTATTAAAAAAISASRTTGASDSNTMALGRNPTQDTDDDDDGDDGSESFTNETMRTPVILSPPTFIQNLPNTSHLGEFQVPGGDGNSIDAFNCSDYVVRPDQDNETRQDGKANNDTEKNQVSVFTKTPCYPNNGGEPDENPDKNRDIRGEKGSGRSGRLLYNEHGYWIGTRFVKTRNGAPDGHGTDTQALVGREEFEHHDVTTPPDGGTVTTEGDDRRPDRKTGSPDRNDPRYHIYIASGPWGTSGYWYRDDELGYVWYRYVGPGQFVLDLDTTNKVRKWEEEKRRKEMSESSAVSSGGERGTTPGSGWRTTSEREATSRSGSGEKVSPAEKESDGYWGVDERGQLAWYRKTVAGYIQKLYPKEDADQRSTDTVPASTAKSTRRFESDDTISHRPGSVLAEDSRSTSRPTTASDPLTREGSDRDDSASRHAEGEPDGDVEYDFWRFVRGRRVWIQYVPPNDLDENDEEKRTRDGPTQAVEIPMDMASSVDAGPEGQWKVIAEKRRAWKSSKTPGDGSSEELLGDSDRSPEDPSTVRLDAETGRQLWTRLVNLTLSSDDSLSDFRTRFQALEEELGDAAAAAAAKTEGNRSDRLHESYWFYDGTGRRFQVIRRRYNVSSGEEFERRDGLFSPPQLNPVAKWEREETQVRGSHDDDATRDSDGAQVRENYGGEYWIRALGPSSKDESGDRKPVDTEALRSRTGLSIDPPDKTAIRPPRRSSALGNTSNRPKKQDINRDRRMNRPASITNIDLSNANNKRSSGVGHRKRHARKPGGKRCRSKRPIFIVFALNAVDNERLDYALTVAQTTVARLTEDSSTEIQVRYYPDFVYSNNSSSSSSDHPGHAPRAVDRGKVAATPDETFTDVAGIFSTDSAERRRSGKPRPRRILALLIDDRLPEGWQTSAGSSKRLPKDVEYLVVGVVGGGTERRVEHLERFAESLRSGRTHVIHAGLLLPHSTSNGIADISEKLVSTICWPLAKTR